MFSDEIKWLRKKHEFTKIIAIQKRELIKVKESIDNKWQPCPAKVTSIKTIIVPVIGIVNRSKLVLNVTILKDPKAKDDRYMIKYGKPNSLNKDFRSNTELTYEVSIHPRDQNKDFKFTLTRVAKVNRFLG